MALLPYLPTILRIEMGYPDWNIDPSLRRVSGGAGHSSVKTAVVEGGGGYKDSAIKWSSNGRFLIAAWAGRGTVSGFQKAKCSVWDRGSDRIFICLDAGRNRNIIDEGR